ncbi:MAG: hypothetical protein KAR06_12970 [Deltaproteobacteria bacterium]|nr:hypothetical protein [Deltaproteobacteria bacterium]
MKKRVAIIIIIASILFTPVQILAGSPGNSVSVVSSDSNGIVLEMRTPEPDVTEILEGEILYHKIAIVGFGSTLVAGTPGLPMKGVLVGIPPASNPGIDAVESDYEEIEGYNIYPVPKPYLIDEEGEERRMDFQFTKDNTVYDMDSFIPSEIAEVGIVGLMRRQSVVQLKFYPIQFNPVSGVLRIHSRIRVKVNFNGSSVAGATAATGMVSSHEQSSKKRSMKGIGGAYERLLEGAIINYDKIEAVE